jgi:protein-S-isoprenylcysteine O-methyltransferase Ste14
MTFERARWFGAIFEIAMILVYFLITNNFTWSVMPWSPWMLPSHFGFFLFTYATLLIFAPQRGFRPPDELITDGPFRYTRHPMYTGLALMDLSYFIPLPASSEPEFFILQGTFFACMCTAAWFNEKETLLRFGKQAEAYYARTPRFFFVYPLGR